MYVLSFILRYSESEFSLILAPKASPAALNEDIIGRYFGGDPSSDLHYETARNWIQACSTHSKCNETVSGSTRIDPYFSPLPTRVIEVTREGGHQRLYLRNTEGLHGAYITLTHRWNSGTELCKTTTENYEERLLGSAFGGLPQLFWDALVITEKLDIKYIWIDSICIIQKGDDYADWGREAPKMAQYYQFSIFTLAGTAEDMSNGILHQQPEDITPWVSNLVRLPYRDKMNTLAGHFYVYRRRMSLVDEYISQVRSSILFKRGWILQEWLLSKRLLWYTPQGLFYECQQELPRAYDQSQLAFNRVNPDLRAHLQLKASFHFSNTNIMNFWYHALEVYSGQHLTKPEKDRIMALSGLAKEVSPILANPKRSISAQIDVQKEIYVAGLWLRDLHYGLLWEQDHSAQAWTTKVKEVPSWSFASLMTPVRWPERAKGIQPAFKLNGVCLRRQDEHDDPDHFVFDNHRLRLANATVETARFNPENSFACLHIRGKLHTVHVRGYLDTEENLKSAALSTAYDTAPKSCNWRAICSAFRPEIIAGWGSLEQMRTDKTTCADFGVAVYALHVSTRYLRHGIWLKTSDPVLDVLFVERVEQIDGKGQVYRRLGVGRIVDGDLIREFEDAEERNVRLI